MDHQLSILFSMQQQLDERIRREHGLESADLHEQKVLALLVELGELANETRCFKYWSNKGSSAKAVVLEEYVDGLHFILSLGLDAGFTDLDLLDSQEAGDLTVQFNQVYEHVLTFKHSKREEDYQSMFAAFLQLGKSLQFSRKEIYKAYMEKNETNHKRQNEGY